MNHYIMNGERVTLYMYIYSAVLTKAKLKSMIFFFLS